MLMVQYFYRDTLGTVKRLCFLYLLPRKHHYKMEPDSESEGKLQGYGDEVTPLLPSRSPNWHRHLELEGQSWSRHHLRATHPTEQPFYTELECCFQFLCAGGFLFILTGWAMITAFAKQYPEFVCRRMPVVEQALNSIPLDWIGTLGLLLWFVLNIAVNWAWALKKVLCTSNLRASAQMLFLLIPGTFLLLEQCLRPSGQALDCKIYL